MSDTLGHERWRVPQADSIVGEREIRRLLVASGQRQGFAWRAVLKYGDQRTTVRNLKDELKTGTYHGMLKQLGLSEQDLFWEPAMQRFTYPVVMTADEKDGGYVVTCRDVPEVVTQGESIEDAISEAEGALEAAIEMRIEDGVDIPLPTTRKRGEYLASLPISTAMKAALYLAMREQNVSKSELARRLGLDEKEARRMLDPKHGTKVPALERALRALGKRVELVVA